jgi:hypothetical protein
MTTSTLTLRRGWSQPTRGSRCVNACSGMPLVVGVAARRGSRIKYTQDAASNPTPNPPSSNPHQDADIPPDVTAEEVGQQPANFKRNYRQVGGGAGGVCALRGSSSSSSRKRRRGVRR